MHNTKVSCVDVVSEIEMKSERKMQWNNVKKMKTDVFLTTYYLKNSFENVLWICKKKGPTTKMAVE